MSHGRVMNWSVYFRSSSVMKGGAPSAVSPFVVLQFLWSYGVVVALPWLIGYFELLPCWTLRSWWVGTVLAAFLWELWVTLGIAGGLPLSQRSSGSAPDWINWFLMAAGDSTCILHVLMMGLALYRVSPHDASIFLHWDWRVLAIMWLAGYAQNILMTIILDAAHGTGDQLRGVKLSWQPLAPTLPLRWDPESWYPFFRIQMCWYFMPPIWNAVLVHGVAGTPFAYPLLTMTVAVVLPCAYMMYFVNAWPTRRNTLPRLGDDCPHVPSANYWSAWQVNSWTKLARAIIFPFALAIALQALSALALLHAVGSDAFQARFCDCSLTPAP